MRIRSKRQIFILCMGVSILCHGLFLALAPRVTLLYARNESDPLLERIRVQIRDDIPAPQPEPPEETESSPPLMSRPGSVRDLLEQRDSYIESPVDAQLEPPTPTPDMVERMSQDIPEAPFDIEQDPNILKRVDSRILEISEEDAREDIEVARRRVRPSSERLLEPGELPSLRSQLTAPEELPFAFRDQTRSLLFEGVSDSPPEDSELLGATPRETLEISGPVSSQPSGRNVDPGLGQESLEAARSAAREESPYTFWDDMLDIRLETYLPPDETEGYFRLQITPKSDANIPALPRQVAFVVDSSNSMTQIKVNAIQRGLRRLIPLLDESTYFNIVAFRDRPNFFQDRAVQATAAHKESALRFINELESRGATDFYSALLPVVQQPIKPDHIGQIFVLSDGRPTTGLQDARAIINGLTSDNAGQYRIFAVGGGNNVNRNLLDLLAYRNKGATHVSDTAPGLSEALVPFYTQFSEPILVAPQAEFNNLDSETIFPRELPDFYLRRPLNIYGRYNPDTHDTFVLRLSGQALDERKEVLFQQAFTDAVEGDTGIPGRWAFQKAYHLIGEISRVGETEALRTELNALSRTYNIRTSYDE